MDGTSTFSTKVTAPVDLAVSSLDASLPFEPISTCRNPLPDVLRMELVLLVWTYNISLKKSISHFIVIDSVIIDIPSLFHNSLPGYIYGYWR